MSNAFPKSLLFAARSVAGLLALVLIAGLLPASVGANSAWAPKPPKSTEAATKTDRVLVRWSPRLSASAAAAGPRLATIAAASGREAQFVRFTGSGAVVYDLGAPLGDDATSILAALGATGEVARVEPDIWMSADTLPDDLHSGDLWGLLGAADGSPYGIHAPGAWATSTGNGVVVAVIDTGLAAHEDLGGQSVAGYDMIEDTTVSRDGNGREADASDPGDWSQFDDPCPPSASTWHGTHVAGTIAALAGNATGVFGGAPGVKIQPVRVLGTCGGYMSDVADGIRWAAGGTVPGVPANSTPARVLNLSFGSTSAVSCPAELASAIADARGRGGVIVVAAGNSGNDASLFAPANCDGVITVAATDQGGKLAWFSNYGSAVELAAPGVSILSTVDSGTTSPAGSTYVSYNGTSMAAPHVAAAAALAVAAHPMITPDSIQSVLAATATVPAPDASAEGCAALGCGAGIVNASRAVASLDTILPVGSVSIEGDAAATTSGTVNVAVPATDASGVSHVRLSNDPGMAGADSRPYATPQSWTLAAGNGTRTVYVQWRDGFGNWSAVGSDSITVDSTPPTASGPTVSVATGAALDRTTVPVTLAWSGSDAGSGLARLEVAQSTNGGAWVPLAVPSPTATTLNRLLPPGSASYRFRVRAIDVAGNASAWLAGPTFRVQRVQESSTAIRYAGTWSRASAAGALGGRYRLTTRARASATYVFTGRSVAWVASRGPAYGSARVYIDGVLRGTVNLRATSASWRRVVFSRTFATSGRHTIRIVGSGTRGHPRVSLDAFVVLK